MNKLKSVIISVIVVITIFVISFMFSSSKFVHSKLGIKDNIDSSKVLSKPVNGYAKPDKSSAKGYSSESDDKSPAPETKNEDDIGLPNEEDGTIHYADDSNNDSNNDSNKDSDKTTTKKDPTEKAPNKDKSENSNDKHYYY